jgi:hypothetical protein
VAKRGPKVGEIVLGVGIYDQDIAKNLTKDILDEIYPALEGWHDRLDQINKDITKIKKESYGQRRRKSGLDRDDFDTTDALQRQLRKKEAGLTAQIARVNRLQRAFLAQKELADKEERRTGWVGKAQQNSLDNARENYAAAKANFRVFNEELAELREKINERQREDEDRYSAAIQEVWKQRIKALEDLRDRERQIKDEMIVDAEKRSEEAIAIGTREYKAREDFYTKLERLERKRERERKARERQRKKELEDEEREKTKLLRALTSAANESARTIGSLVNLGRVAPPVLGVAAVLASELALGIAAVVQSLYAAPAAFAAFGAAAGTLAIGFYGLEDAIKAALDPDFDPAKLAEALNQISPAAQGVVLAIRNILPSLEELRDSVQNSLFAGIGDQLLAVTDTFMPTVDYLFSGIADQMNQAFMMVTDTMMSTGFMDKISEFADNVLLAFEKLQPAMVPLTEAFGRLLAAGSSALPMLADYVADLANRFADFIYEAEQSGDLDKWIEQGTEALIELSKLVENLITELFELGPVGYEMLPQIVDTINGLIDILPALINFFGMFGGEIAAALEDLGNIAEVIQYLERLDMGGPVLEWQKLLNPVALMLEYLREIAALIDKVTEWAPFIPDTNLADRISDSNVGKILLGNDPAKVLPWVGGGGPINDSLSQANKWVEADRAGKPPLRSVSDLPPGMYRRRDGSVGGVPKDKMGGQPLTGDAKSAQKGPSDAEKRKENERSIDPNDFLVDLSDVFADQPGNPGKAPLSVTVENMPESFGSAGASAVRGLPAAALPDNWQEQLAGIPDAMGAKPVIDVLGQLAAQFGLNVASGVRNEPGSYHHTGNAGDFSNVGRYAPPSPEMDNLAMALLSPQLVPYIQELIYQGIPANILNGELVPAINEPNSPYTDAAAGYHGDHVHVAIKDENAEEFLAQLTALLSSTGVSSGAQVGDVVPRSLKDDLYTANGPLEMDYDGTLGYRQFNQKDIDRAAQAVKDAANDLQSASYDFAVANENFKDGLISQQDLIEAERRKAEAEQRLENEKEEYREVERGKFKEYDNPELKKTKTKKAKELTLDDLPFGHPTKILGEMILGAGGTQADVQGLMGGLMGNTVAGLADGIFPQQMTPTAPSTPYQTLIEQKNPMALAAMAGLDVPDFTRQGGGESAQNVMQGDQTMTANGQIMSNTSALIDRTLTNMDQADKARHEQTMSVLNQIAKRLGADVLGPTLESGVDAGISGLSNEVVNQLGRAIGQSAGPIIADAVAAKLGSASSSPGASVVNNGVGGVLSAVAGVAGFAGMASGGGVTGGTPGKDSVPAMLMPGEWVLTRNEVAAMGGFAGMQRFRAGLLDSGGVVGMAAGGAVTGGLPGKDSVPAMLKTDEWVMTRNEITQMGGFADGAAVTGGLPGKDSVPAMLKTDEWVMTRNEITQMGGFAAGGAVTGGAPGKDSVPAMLMPGEWVLTRNEVAAMGGFAGMQRFRAGLLNSGGVRYMATGGGVDVSSTVGAEFFGVSQVPILGAIVNLLIGVLLRVLGVNIEARDTLNEISGDFRDFRGEFLAFESSGRLRNDTSGLMDRSTSSAQTAADERIKILRLVLDALVKYIIEKVIVPIGKAIGSALLQAGEGALSAGLGAAFPGGSIVGGIVGSAVTAGGSAAMDIAAEVWGQIGQAAFSVAFQGIGELLQSYLPDITTDLFGGVGMARLFDPITSGFSGILGGFAAMLASITDVVAGMFPGVKFDSGGVAHGVGMMPKATLKPERVLSPQQTASFDRLVDALTAGRVSTGSSTTIHAPFTVTGDEKGGRIVHNRLLALMS